MTGKMGSECCAGATATHTQATLCFLRLDLLKALLFLKTPLFLKAPLLLKARWSNGDTYTGNPLLLKALLA